jgi:hypothetical protein
MKTSAGSNGSTDGSGCDSLWGRSRPNARTGAGETADLYCTSTLYFHTFTGGVGGSSHNREPDPGRRETLRYISAAGAAALTA